MSLAVLLHDETVGWIRRSPSSILSFHFDEKYIETDAHNVLGQFFEETRNWAEYRMSKHPGRLPAFFSNLLPEGGLRGIVESQLSAKDEMQLLARVGSDLPGAVTVHDVEDDRDFPPTRDRIVFEEGSPTTVEPSDEWHFSLAGVQLKFSAVQHQSGRFALPFRGEGGRWILKFGSPGFPELVENEFATMSWAKLCGIDVPPCKLVDAAELEDVDPRFLQHGSTVFAIERFDRPLDGGRIHQEDFAQVRCLLPEYKYHAASYEGLARFIGDLCGPSDLIEYIRRLFFSIVAGNTDAHLKNWSLIYPDGKAARLSPAYDLVFVRQYKGDDKLALKLANENVPERLSWDHVRRLERFLIKFGHHVEAADIARDTINTALEIWREHPELGTQDYRRLMDTHLAALPLAVR